MSGGLFVNALRREIGHPFDAEEAARMQQTHSEAYLRRVDQVRALPGAKQLLATLTQAGVPWAIATSGRRRSAGHALRSEEHTSELQSRVDLVCRLLLEKKKTDHSEFRLSLERTWQLFLGACECYT